MHVTVKRELLVVIISNIDRGPVRIYKYQTLHKDFCNCTGNNVVLLTEAFDTSMAFVFTCMLTNILLVNRNIYKSLCEIVTSIYTFTVTYIMVEIRNVDWNFLSNSFFHKVLRESIVFSSK